MFGIGLPELIIILVVALIVVGPSKLPDLAKSLGKGLSEFRKATDDLKSQITDNDTYQDVTHLRNNFKDTLDSMKPANLLDTKELLEPKQPKLNVEGRQKVMESIDVEAQPAQDQGQAQGQPAPAEGAQPPDQADTAKAKEDSGKPDA